MEDPNLQINLYELAKFIIPRILIKHEDEHYLINSKIPRIRIKQIRRFLLQI